MKAQELPLSTIVIIVLGVLFLIVLVIIFGNATTLSSFFGSIFQPSGDDCIALCNQANGFEGSVSELAFCTAGCDMQCTVYDSQGALHYLHEECPQT